jgi:hypothetical protein
MSSNRSPQVELAIYSQQPATAALIDTELHANDGIEPSNGDLGFSLPPTDGGKDAWLCLFACFMLEALIWGTSS